MYGPVKYVQPQKIWFSAIFVINKVSTLAIFLVTNSVLFFALKSIITTLKQLLDEVEHDIMNYQNRGLCYLQKLKAEADNTDTRFQ